MTEQNGVERSSIIDELRIMAESVGLAVPKAATLMMQAADQLDFVLDSKRIAERSVTKLLEENAKLKTKLKTKTCSDTGESRIFHCSECDLGLDDVYIDDEERYPFADFPRFCPFCGAEVVWSE